MRVPLVAGNWKLHKTVSESRQLLADMLPGLTGIPSVEKLLCPPFTALSAVAELLKGKDVSLGAQDMYWETSGAYTGEISAPMLAEFCQYVIIGHSERRAYFHETDETVNHKTRSALSHKLKPIVCVGETLEENEDGRAAEVISRQLRDSLAGINITSGDDLVIAYEPVWAIGTGKAATADGVNTLIRNVIRTTLSGLFGDEIISAMRVLYGGSVKADNATEYFQQPEIDGSLVGGASLQADQFIGIARAAAA
jgi:triosephosphate isomerase